MPWNPNDGNEGKFPVTWETAMPKQGRGEGRPTRSHWSALTSANDRENPQVPSRRAGCRDCHGLPLSCPLWYSLSQVKHPGGPASFKSCVSRRVSYLYCWKSKNSEGGRDTFCESGTGQVLMNPTVREDFGGNACPTRGQAAEGKLVTRGCYSTGLSKC